MQATFTAHGANQTSGWLIQHERVARSANSVSANGVGVVGATLITREIRSIKVAQQGTSPRIETLATDIDEKNF